MRESFYSPQCVTKLLNERGYDRPSNSLTDVLHWMYEKYSIQVLCLVDVDSEDVFKRAVIYKRDTPNGTNKRIWESTDIYYDVDETYWVGIKYALETL